MEKISTKDLYWCCAFIDGEGWISSRGGDTTPTVGASQNARELLDRLSGFLGGNVKLHNQKYKGQIKPIHTWRVYGARAVGVMMTIYSIMSEKRKFEIREALKIWRNKPTLRGEKNYQSAGSDVEVENILRRVMNGEYICDVSRDTGVTQKTIGSWLDGKRGYILEKLKSEGLEYKGQMKRLSGESHHASKVSDEIAIIAIKRVLSGESQQSVADSIGVSQSTIGFWAQGKVKPYLLASIKEEQQLGVH